MRNNAPRVVPTSNGGSASAANAIINEGNIACKRNGAAKVKKWRVDEFGHCSAENYQNMKKGTSLTPAWNRTRDSVQIESKKLLT